jgi:ABC-2 type transport system permease protein
MRTILYLLQKEFIQVFRNKAMLPIIFIMPLMQMLILVFAATMEIKKVNITIVDLDLSKTSTGLTSKLEASSFFHLQRAQLSPEETDQILLKGKTGLVVTIPSGFEEKLKRNDEASLQVMVDAINGSAAELSNAYLQTVIGSYNMKIRAEMMGVPKFIPPQQVTVIPSYWYNPELNFKFYMAPGILVILVTIIGLFLSSLNLVREKELGTIEQLNVTPIKKYHFIIGKMMPFLIIALLDLTFGLLVAKVVFGLPFRGNILTLYAFTTVYLFLVMSMGLFVSAISDTQQQVLFVSFFFLIVFIIMSGLFTPVESMPAWAQKLDMINPLYYLIRIVRNVVLKGSGLLDMSRELIYLSVYGVIMFSLAVWRYRKTV